MPFEKAIDLVEDLETQHMVQLGLLIPFPDQNDLAM
jgi:hypothetical protein